MERVRVIDSHTEGEPTRVVVGGGPDLGPGTAVERLERLRQHHDDFRAAIVNEPRGHDAMVGALLSAPSGPGAVAEVIFFNNVGFLGMCAHGTIGIAATLAWLGRIQPGEHRIETPVGDVVFVMGDDGWVSVRNVPSYRLEKGVAVDTEHHGSVVGDIAWGGNWFFLVGDHGQRLALDNLARLTEFTHDVRESLARAGITGQGGAEIDHVELFGPPTRADADSRNFVLCPGGVCDRSPCGTGASAKIACLWADGELEPGQPWRQESIIGSRFTCGFEISDERVVATIAGRAWVTGDATLVMQDSDPFRRGVQVR